VLAQHTALMLNRLDISARHEAIRRAMSRLEQRLETRKAVSRASGILANMHHLPHEQGLAILLRQARTSRRPLLPLARAIILGQQTGHLQPVSLRRLGPNELTNAAGA